LKNSHIAYNSIVEGALAKIGNDPNDPIVWNDNKTLSDNQGNSYNPQVAVTPSGRVVAIWRFLDDGGNYKIQYMNNVYYNEKWDILETLSDSDVTANGLQYVVADAAGKYQDLVYAYWSDLGSQNPIHFSESISQNIPWSEGKLITSLNVGLELDATLFNEILQLIWWQQDTSESGGSINVGYPLLTQPPILDPFTLAENDDLAYYRSLMIASNDTKDMIVAIWIGRDANNGQKLLKAAHGPLGPVGPTSKMLMYWGIDEAFQSHLP